jgi:dipeptidase E
MERRMMSETEHKRVLLISNSTLYGSGYLDHAENEIRSLLGNVKSVLFVPFALYDRDAYASTARERFQKMGYGLESIHTAADAHQAVNDAEAVFIGGGNTFRLLKALYDMDVLQTIWRRVAEGMPYVGVECRRKCRWPNHQDNQRHADRSTSVLRCPRASPLSN